MFEKGEFIVYGSTGVCEVKDITTLDMKGASKNKHINNTFPLFSIFFVFISLIRILSSFLSSIQTLPSLPYYQS